MLFRGTAGMECSFQMFWTYLLEGLFLSKALIETQTKFLLLMLILKKSWDTWKNSQGFQVDTFGHKLKLSKETRM